MSKIRQHKREAKALETKLRNKLIELTESFTNVFMQHTFSDGSDINLERTLENHDRVWKQFASNIVKKHPGFYKDFRKKARLLNAFSEFVSKMNDQSKQPTDDKSGNT